MLLNYTFLLDRIYKRIYGTRRLSHIYNASLHSEALVNKNKNLSISIYNLSIPAFCPVAGLLI